MAARSLAAAKDVISARSDLAEVRDALIRAQYGVHLARASLNRLLGRSLNKPVEVADLRAQPVVPANEAGAVEAELKHRPELLSLRLLIPPTGAATILATSQTLPSLSVRAAAVHQTPSVFLRSQWYAAGLALQWPVADGGKATLDRREEEASAQRLRALLAEAETGVELALGGDKRTLSAHPAARQLKPPQKPGRRASGPSS